MLWIWGALWGAAGGATVELLALSADIKVAHQVPWKDKAHGPWPDLLAMMLRVLAGALLAGAAADSGEVAGAFGAFGFGVAAPMIVEKLVDAFAPAPSVRGEASSQSAEVAAAVTTEEAGTDGR